MTRTSAIILYRQLGWSTEVLVTKNEDGKWDLPHDNSNSPNVAHTVKSIAAKSKLTLPTTLNYLGQSRQTADSKIMGYMRDVHACELRIPLDGSAKFVSLREALFLVTPEFIPLLETFYANHTHEYRRHCA